MSAWYEKTFGHDYLSLYPHRNDEEATRDISDLLKLIEPHKEDQLLDLCCGAGRHLMALRHAGFNQLTGLDLSADLLAEARTRLDNAGMDDIQLVRADMRDIPEIVFYSTIVSLFTSFGYFVDRQDDERVLASAYRALASNGTFVLDTLNRGQVLASLIPEEAKELGDRHIHIRRRITEDGLRVEKETRVTQPGSPETMYRESVRMYEREEIEGMLAGIGFVNTRFFGSLQGQAYSSSSPRMVFATSKAGA